MTTIIMTCPACKGSGLMSQVMDNETECWLCDGSGEVEKRDCHVCACCGPQHKYVNCDGARHYYTAHDRK